MVKRFICDFFSLINIFLGEFDVELIFINGLDSLETLKFKVLTLIWIERKQCFSVELFLFYVVTVKMC